MTAEQYEGRAEMAIRAFPDNLVWLNVPAPLTIEALRGKIVILDFWTYGCINCMHMLPVLAKLEEKYPDELVVIGVHSAKFANEGEYEQIRQIIKRYDIDHPVINDKDFMVWNAFQVQAWPTFGVIDPRGNLLAMQGGEIPFDGFDQLIGGMVAHFDTLGEINREPLQFDLEGDREPDSLLRYPGKVLVDAEGGRLFIADSGHHRIVVLDLHTHALLDVIGSGEPGYEDDTFENAQFRSPQGMALKGGRLYIADTNNHAVRSVDFETRTVRTLAGTGYMGVGIMTFGTKIREPRAFDLRSPWDVTAGADDTLFIAMAGTHQIAEVNLKTRVMRVSVGNGREALYNDTLGTSELAQPSGLHFENGLLYFADSESSSIRVADFTNDTVRTLAGPIENSLFTFGDVDGQIGTSRLQHPLGITGDEDGNIYIADTYNNKIKVIDATTHAETLLDGFNEPGGLDYHDAKLYIADTNNHVVRMVDIASKSVKTITPNDPQKLITNDHPTVIAGQFTARTVLMPRQTVIAGEGQIKLHIDLPDGYVLNANMPGAVQVDAHTPQELTSTEIVLPITWKTDAVAVQLSLYYCQADEKTLCFIERVRLEIPIEVSDGRHEVSVNHVVTLPEIAEESSAS